MGEGRLRFAAMVLGAFSLVVTVFAAPVVLNLALQPDSASNFPGGTLLVVVQDAASPIVGHNVTVHAADGSWTDHCTTASDGACAFDPLPGAKGTVSAGNATRAFFLPEGQSATWALDVGAEDDGAPLGLGPVDAVPTALVLVAGLFGIAAAISMWRRASLRLAVVGVGLTGLANLLVYQPAGLIAATLAGYALWKDARLFGAVPLDGTDVDEEEE